VGGDDSDGFEDSGMVRSPGVGGPTVLSPCFMNSDRLFRAGFDNLEDRAQRDRRIVE
jgi:hypothetical protein